MHAQPTLATRFANNTTVLRSENPLTEDQMRQVAPSIFALSKHSSRSERYAYIPTIDVLRGLSAEGFQPFMVAQGKSRIAGKSEYTKHMIRMRHSGQVQARSEANEIILINSHDGASSYQMLAGVFRFVCCNGMVVGEICDDVRVKHTGNAQGEVVDAAFRVLSDFDKVDQCTEEMKLLRLDEGEARAFATAALAVRFGESPGDTTSAPITVEQLVEARRPEDIGRSLWSTFQRVQENALRGGLTGRSVQGRRIRTRPVASIDRSVSINRALWILAEEMRKLKAS